MLCLLASGILMSITITIAPMLRSKVKSFLILVHSGITVLEADTCAVDICEKNMANVDHKIHKHLLVFLESHVTDISRHSVLDMQRSVSKLKNQNVACRSRIKQNVDINLTFQKAIILH